MNSIAALIAVMSLIVVVTSVPMPQAPPSPIKKTMPKFQQPAFQLKLDAMLANMNTSPNPIRSDTATDLNKDVKENPVSQSMSPHVVPENLEVIQNIFKDNKHPLGFGTGFGTPIVFNKEVKENLASEAMSPQSAPEKLEVIQNIFKGNKHPLGTPIEFNKVVKRSPAFNAMSPQPAPENLEVIRDILKNNNHPMGFGTGFGKLLNQFKSAKENTNLTKEEREKRFLFGGGFGFGYNPYMFGMYSPFGYGAYNGYYNGLFGGYSPFSMYG
jgi:hypothetical protein